MIKKYTFRFSNEISN